MEVINDNQKNKNQWRTEVIIRNPWKIYINGQNQITENSRLKVKYSSKYTKDNYVILISMTKTLLNKGVREEVDLEQLAITLPLGESFLVLYSTVKPCYRGAYGAEAFST